jgi:hypothetical protein
MVIYRLYTDYSISAHRKINEQATYRDFRFAGLLAGAGQTKAQLT